MKLQKIVTLGRGERKYFKYQIVLPSDVVAELRWNQGDLLEGRMRSDGLLLSKVGGTHKGTSRSPIDAQKIIKLYEQLHKDIWKLGKKANEDPKLKHELLDWANELSPIASRAIEYSTSKLIRSAISHGRTTIQLRLGKT